MDSMIGTGPELEGWLHELCNPRWTYLHEWTVLKSWNSYEVEWRLKRLNLMAWVGRLMMLNISTRIWGGWTSLTVSILQKDCYTLGLSTIDEKGQEYQLGTSDWSRSVWIWNEVAVRRASDLELDQQAMQMDSKQIIAAVKWSIDRWCRQRYNNSTLPVKCSGGIIWRIEIWLKMKEYELMGWYLWQWIIAKGQDARCQFEFGEEMKMGSNCWWGLVEYIKELEPEENNGVRRLCSLKLRRKRRTVSERWDVTFNTQFRELRSRDKEECSQYDASYNLKQETNGVTAKSPED